MLRGRSANPCSWWKRTDPARAQRRARPDPGGDGNDASMLCRRNIELNLELMASLGILWLFLTIAAYAQVNAGTGGHWPTSDARSMRSKRNPAARLVLASSFLETSPP